MKSQNMIAALDCSLVLPIDSNAESNGVKSAARVISFEKDRRRFPRFECQVEAAMQYQGGLPAIPRSKKWVRVPVRNVSRCGIRFLHGEQVFPQEKVLLVLPEGVQRVIEVRECHRIGPKCFDVGGEFAGHVTPRDREG